MTLDAPDDNPDRHLERERALFRYYCALERGDFETVHDILDDAENDSNLDRMIQELNDALEAEDDVPEEEEVRGAVEPTTLRGLAQRYRPAPRENDRSTMTHSLSGRGTGSALRVADLDEWHSDPDYSVDVAQLLTHAYAESHAWRQSSTAIRIAQQSGRLLNRTMSRSQRLRVCYVYGIVKTELGDYDTGLEAITEAFELARSLRASGAIVELLVLRSRLNVFGLAMREASEDLCDCLHILHTMNDAPDVSDIPFEVTVRVQLASLLLYLADFDRVKEQLDSACKLQSHATPDPLSSATIAWLYAHLERLRGNSRYALWLADDAAETYSHSGLLASTARLNIFVAETALDCAEALPHGTERSNMIHQSFARLEASRRLATRIHDQSAIDLGTLAGARSLRLLGRSPEIAKIHTILMHARRAAPTVDLPLMAQALTVLGDDYAHLGNRSAALDAYRRTVEVLDGSDVPILGIWARRALLRHEEGIDE